MSLGKFLFSFEGRTGRKGFWLYTLAMFVVVFILNMVALAPLMMAIQSGDQAAVEGASVPIWVWILFIPLIWTSLAVQAKRWHDQDKSAWWILIGLIPFIGGLIVLIMCGFLPGTPGPNRFGEPPA